VGETRVDLLHLLEDLRDAYPGALEETILTEIVANSLDSGATRLVFAADPTQATLTVLDDGSGMARRELARYHDVAASTKTRGQGIGFAGVGIKLGLLTCEDVVTETRRGKTHVATSWHLASRHRAPWRWIPPPGLVETLGTAVRLRLRNPLSPLLEAGFIEATLQRDFEPLLDTAFDEILAAHYPAGIRFLINGREIPKVRATAGRAPLAVRMGRKRKPAAVGYLFRDDATLREARRGVAVSTLGKVIKRGWDWLGVSPAAPDRVGGLVEVPPLSEILTLNKADFIRTGPRGMTYLAYRKAIQEAVSAQLAAWGDSRNETEEARRRRARPLERDLQTVLVDLAEEFPLLASLVERQAGGQRRLSMGEAGERLQAMPALEAASSTGSETAALPESDQSAIPAPTAPSPEAPPPEPGDAASTAAAAEAPSDSPAATSPLPGRRGPRRPARYGLSVRFESRPDDPELGRLVESTVWVNEAHPAFRRALSSHSEGYHTSLTVAMALAPLAVEPPQVHGFVTAFLARWGAALEREPGRRRRRPACPGRRSPSVLSDHTGSENRGR